MNERIRELEAECWEHDQSWTGVGQRVFNSKKFAELIVQECVSVVEGGSFLHDQAPTAIFARECSAAVKRHFGVDR